MRFENRISSDILKGWCKTMNTILKMPASNSYNNKQKTAYTKNTTEAENVRKDILKEATQKMKEAIENYGFKTEEDKMKYEKELNEKIETGAELSPSEMNYLQRTNPMMYTRIKRIQMQRQMLKDRLKQCRSKKEVEETYSQAIVSIGKKDPDKGLLIKAYDNVTSEFKKTNQYKQLPQDKEDKKDRKNRLGSHLEDETKPTFNVKC